MKITINFTVSLIDNLLTEATMQLMIRIINLITNAGGANISIDMDVEE